MEGMLVFSSVLLWLMVLLNLLLTLGLARRIRAALPKVELLKVGQPAPDFTAQTLEGQTVSLADFIGQPVAFMFTSPDCPSCREQLPTIQHLKAKLAERGIKLVLVSDRETSETLTLAQKVGDQLPILIAPRNRNSLLIDYKIPGVPSYCLVDEHGRVRAAGMGSLDESESIP